MNEAVKSIAAEAVLKQHVIGHMGQHTGAEATDTSWLSVKVGEEPDWLMECGGSLAKARDLLAAMGLLQLTLRDLGLPTGNHGSGSAPGGRWARTCPP